LPTVLDALKRRLFWIVARTCFTLYGWFPLFGKLRASIAIIQRDGRFLIIQRSDGRGFSLPGGISSWREAAEETLRREVLEETGLSVTRNELMLQYFTRAEIPCTISVFEVQASGELKDSWEGPPTWATFDELVPRLLPSQRPVLEVLRKLATDTEVK
jgi:8-oxo-dGTP pyrophosphatase MutT (NUDIX family)